MAAIHTYRSLPNRVREATGNVSIAARIATSSHASTSTTQANFPLLLCGRPDSSALCTHSGLRIISCCARRRDSSGSDGGERGPRDGGFQFSRRRGMYRFQYNEYEAEVREDEAWKLGVPLLGGLLLAASLIGPLIIGVAFTAVALGAAVSAGALFTSLFLPLFLLVGAGALLFGGLAFSAFATLGTALLLPKLVSMAVAGVGLGAGALAVSLFLKPAAERAKVSYEEAEGPRGGARRGSRERDSGPVVEAESEALDPDVDRQLREFDSLLAEREAQRRREERRGGGRGREPPERR